MTLDVLLIGCGDMGRSCHLSVLKTWEQSVRLVGIVRRSADGIEGFPDVPIFGDLEQAFEMVRPNLTIVATPHAFHASQVKVALSHNCHVFVEKPISLDFAQADDLSRFAEIQERLLVVGLQRRYEGFCRIFQNLAQTGRIGEVLLMQGLFAHSFLEPWPRGWRADPTIAGAGILDDSAYHLLDVLIYCAASSVKQITGCKALMHEAGLPHSFSANFEMTSGMVISACCSYLAPRQSVQEEVSIYGTEGSLFLRRFCQEWNVEPPQVFYKSRDGTQKESFDLSARPSGRNLPLETMLGVLLNKRPKSDIVTEAKNVLETHRAIDLLRRYIDAR